MTLKIYFLLLAWGAFTVTFALLFTALANGIMPLFDLESGDLWRQLFQFVVILDVTLFALYFTFPAIQFFQSYYSGDLSVYLRSERNFIIASFVTKTVLTLIVLISGVMRDEQESNA